jgi:hypothetical protein
MQEYIKARCRHDFEFCASNYFYITDGDATTPKDVLFVLNRSQRDLLKIFYDGLKYNKPVRVIIDKSRQQGFSTLTQLFFAWLQTFVLQGSNSCIVAHVENTARIIRGMYTKMLDKLPPWLLNMDKKLALTPFERGNKTLIIKGIGSRVTIGSAEKPNNIVGDKISFVHFSEVGLYKTTQGIKPEQLIQSILGGVAYTANTIVVYESTARGVFLRFYSPCSPPSVLVINRPISSFVAVLASTTPVTLPLPITIILSQSSSNTSKSSPTKSTATPFFFCSFKRR